MDLKNKFILDATAGFKMMWYNKQHPNVLYIDERPECEPDLIADFKNLDQIPDNSFNLIIFDPPHLLRKNKLATMTMVRRFGALEADTWQIDLKKGFNELWRVLEPGGYLIFKWSNYDISCAEILKLSPATPLIYQIAANKYRTANGKRKGLNSGADTVQTLWFLFMKPKTELPK
jgi:SAM-dependent methyltransferase